jgi:hypothetical protein
LLDRLVTGPTAEGGKNVSNAREVGRVSTDTGAILVIDPMYLMTDEDHDAGRTPEQLAPGYDAVHIDARRDGTFPVFVEYDEAGTPQSIRIDLQP